MSTIVWGPNCVFPCLVSAMGSRTVWMDRMRALTAEVRGPRALLCRGVHGLLAQHLGGCYSSRSKDRPWTLVGMRPCPAPKPRLVNEISGSLGLGTLITQPYGLQLWARLGTFPLAVCARTGHLSSSSQLLDEKCFYTLFLIVDYFKRFPP